MDEIFSLRKSAVRREVLSYLAKVNGSYVAEIAKATGHSPSQVIGALRGLKQGYKEENSLLALGLVEICGGGEEDLQNNL